MPSLRRLLTWKCWRPATGGFTLIELTIALAVTAIFSAGVTLSYHTSERRALNDASRTLQSELRYAQRMAMIEGRRWGVMFDVGNDVYHVYSTEPLVIEKTAALPNGVSFMETSAPDMEYLPRGTGLRALKITLKKGRYWQKMTATVSGGRIEIKPVEELSVTP